MKISKESLMCLSVFAALCGTAAADSPGFHGMLIVGEENIYISHLPLFQNSIHRYQGIWEVSFGEDGDRQYREDRRSQGNGGQIYTLNPTEKFALPELLRARKSFGAEIYRGHFERPGHKKLPENVTVTIKRVVHFHRFEESDQRPSDLLYFSFGNGTERFLAHWISVPPNYDQILAVAASDPRPPFDWLPEGTWVSFPGRDDRANRLDVGDKVVGRVLLNPAVSAEVGLNVIRDYYLELDELKAGSDEARVNAVAGHRAH